MEIDEEAVLKYVQKNYRFDKRIVRYDIKYIKRDKKRVWFTLSTYYNNGNVYDNPKHYIKLDVLNPYLRRLKLEKILKNINGE